MNWGLALFFSAIRHHHLGNNFNDKNNNSYNG